MLGRQRRYCVGQIINQSDYEGRSELALHRSPYQSGVTNHGQADCNFPNVATTIGNLSHDTWDKDCDRKE
jgi:hypothetical protein